MGKRENMMILESIVFKDGGKIPQDYTCDGSNRSPSLEVRNIPVGVKSYVLVMNDLSAESQGKVNHWVVWNVPAVSHIDEGELPAGSVEGTNDLGEVGYVGPCPRSGEHIYEFKIYALITFLDATPSSILSDIIDEMDGFIVAESSFVGKYERQDVAEDDFY